MSYIPSTSTVFSRPIKCLGTVLFPVLLFGLLQVQVAAASPSPSGTCSYPPSVSPNPTISSAATSYPIHGTVELTGIGWPSGGTVMVTISPDTEISNAYPVVIGPSGKLSVSLPAPDSPETLYISAHCGTLIRTLTLAITNASMSSTEPKAGTAITAFSPPTPGLMLISLLTLVILGVLFTLQFLHNHYNHPRPPSNRTPHE